MNSPIMGRAWAWRSRAHDQSGRSVAVAVAGWTDADECECESGDADVGRAVLAWGSGSAMELRNGLRAHPLTLVGYSIIMTVAAPKGLN